MIHLPRKCPSLMICHFLLSLAASTSQIAFALPLFPEELVEVFAEDPSELFLGGVTVGNGGDLVDCGDGKVYSLDYVLSPKENMISAQEDAFEYIRQNLNRLSPAMARSFIEFKEQAFSTKAEGQTIWQASKLPLIDIKDEQLIQILPEYCVETDTQTGMDKLKIKQAVIRTTQSGIKAVRFTFDADLIEELKAQDALQFSHLTVHEWLWQYTQDAWKVRALNYLLHSQALALIDGNQFREIMHGLVMSEHALSVALDQELIELSGEIAARACTGNTVQTFVTTGPSNSWDLSYLSASTFVFDVSPLPDSKQLLCGLGILYRSLDGDPVGLHASLNFGFLNHSWFFMSQQGSQLTSESICEDKRCFLRSGELQNFLSVKNLFSGKWKLSLQPDKALSITDLRLVLFLKNQEK